MRVGTISIGIDDDGNMIGLENVDDVQLKVKDRIKNNIMPSTLGLFDVICETNNGKSYIKINIASGPEKPYYIKNMECHQKGAASVLAVPLNQCLRI